MMKFLQYFILLIFVLCVTYINTSNGLMCYGCAAVIGSGDSCETSNTEYMLKMNCSIFGPMDNLRCMRAEINFNGQMIIDRTCSMPDTCATLGELGKNCVECKEDYCNIN